MGRGGANVLHPSVYKRMHNVKRYPPSYAYQAPMIVPTEFKMALMLHLRFFLAHLASLRDFTVYSCRRVTIYILTMWRHPEQDRFPFKSDSTQGFFLMVPWFCLATLTYRSCIRDKSKSISVSGYLKAALCEIKLKRVDWLVAQLEV